MPSERGQEMVEGPQPKETAASKFWGVKDVNGSHIIKPLVAEFVGTLFLVYIACGSCLVIDGGTFFPKGHPKPTILSHSGKDIKKIMERAAARAASAGRAWGNPLGLPSGVYDDGGPFAQLGSTLAIGVVGVAFAFGITVASIAQVYLHKMKLNKCHVINNLK